VSAVSILGEVNSALDSAPELTITLTGEVLENEIEAGEDLTEWFTNLPRGLKAAAKTDAAAKARTIIVSITGTPEEAKEETPLAITILAAYLSRGEDIKVKANTAANFTIAPETTSAVHIAGVTGSFMKDEPDLEMDWGDGSPPEIIPGESGRASIGNYWKYDKGGEILADISMPNNASPYVAVEPHAVAANSTGVYFAGVASTGLANEASTNRKVIYWKNGGAIVELSDGTTDIVAVSSMALNGADVYILASNRVYKVSGGAVASGWENGKSLISEAGASLQNIVFANGTLYFGGTLGGSSAKYWKYDIASGQTASFVDLSAKEGAADMSFTSIAVSGTDVYLAGRKRGTPTTVLAAAYWKADSAGNVTETLLEPLETNRNSLVNAIAISGSDIYLAGYWTPEHQEIPLRYRGSVAAYWKVTGGTVKQTVTADDIERTELTTQEAHLSTTNSVKDTAQYIAIDSNGSDVYTVGYVTPRNESQHPAYWKNSDETRLPENVDGQTTRVTAIAVSD
jgi:hypothetical protein